MSNVAALTAKHPLVGTWRFADPFNAVEFRIAAAPDGFEVQVVDADDETRAEVYDVVWDGEVLRLAVHWPSTGRFTKYALRALTKDSVGVDFTYSGQDTLLRADT